MECLPQKFPQLECKNGKLVTETTPLKTSESLVSSYLSQETGQQADKERRKRRKMPSSVPKISKKGPHRGQNGTISHRDESVSTLVEEGETEGEGDHHRHGGRGLVALQSRVTLVLKNTGSVARDHLASERTFLAYMKMSLTLVTAAIALAQVSVSAMAQHNYPRANAVVGLETTMRTLTASTAILGIIVLFIGTQRYFAIQSALTMGKFPAARLLVLMIALSLLVLTSITFSILLTGGVGV